MLADSIDGIFSFQAVNRMSAELKRLNMKRSCI